MSDPNIVLGIVADDLTGASDVASFLKGVGAKCLLINGIPPSCFRISSQYDVVIIALKSRISPVQMAVHDSIHAFKWLKENGTQMLYFKYCSTFDSTPNGNIGPVADAVLEEWNIPYTILCPALPVNKRTVKNGHLFVNGIPLNRTHMKNHPLNPMWDSRISNLMLAQSKYPSLELDHMELQDPKEEIFNRINLYQKKYQHFYIVVDFFTEEHGKKISKLFHKLPFLTGGSALPTFLYRDLKPDRYGINKEYFTFKKLKTNMVTGLILSGSLSTATVNQINFFKSKGYPCWKINPREISENNNYINRIWNYIDSNRDMPILIYSEKSSLDGMEFFSEDAPVIENALSELGLKAINAGIQNIVVAGGETSGAFIGKLATNSFEIGPVIDPGVPIIYPSGYKNLKVVLKSGNFGKEDFFIRALQTMEEVNQSE